MRHTEMDDANTNTAPRATETLRRKKKKNQLRPRLYVESKLDHIPSQIGM